MSDERRRGRKPLDPSGSTPLTVQIPNSLFDDTCEISESTDVPFRELVRMALRRLVNDVKSGTVTLQRRP